MDATELRARTAWGLVSQPGDALAWHLQRTLGPEEALGRMLEPPNSSRLDIPGLSSAAVAAAFSQYRSHYCEERVTRAIQIQRHENIVALSADHPWWPVGVDDLGDKAPSTLWIKGSLHGATVSPAVAIVGSHIPTWRGRSATLALGDTALRVGLTLVGGGTRGITTDAHRRVITGGGISVAILPGGIDTAYPPENAALFGRMTQRGALISEAPCTQEPSLERFLARNRLIAAMSDGVAIVEAEFRSAAISVAYHAAALGRHVGVVPGLWGDTRSAGCWRIYRECGAMVLTEPAELSLLVPGVNYPSSS